MTKKRWKALWLIIVLLFVAMEVYHFVMGNYVDMIASLTAVIIILLIVGIASTFKKEAQ